MIHLAGYPDSSLHSSSMSFEEMSLEEGSSPLPLGEESFQMDPSSGPDATISFHSDISEDPDEEVFEAEVCAKLAHESISSLLLGDLCTCHCNRQWSYNHILFARQSLYFHKNRADLLQTIKAKLEVMYNLSKDSFSLTILGKSTCVTAWKGKLPFSLTLFSNHLS